MPASASRSATCPTSCSAVLPRWVKEVLTLNATRGCVVSMSRGEFVVKVHPTEEWLKPHQPQGADRPSRRVPREEDVQLPGTRTKTARKLRSADRARRHAAQRHRSLLRLQGLMRRNVQEQITNMKGRNLRPLKCASEFCWGLRKHAGRLQSRTCFFHPCAVQQQPPLGRPQTM